MHGQSITKFSGFKEQWHSKKIRQHIYKELEISLDTRANLTRQ